MLIDTKIEPNDVQFPSVSDASVIEDTPVVADKSNQVGDKSGNGGGGGKLRSFVAYCIASDLVPEGHVALNRYLMDLILLHHLDRVW